MPKRPPAPKEKTLFADSPAIGKPGAVAVQINIDGGSRGNPGPAAYGVLIRDARGETLARLKKYIGRMTNNVAKYYGLIAALDYAQSHSIRAVRIESDSELLVKQMRGLYKVKSEDLRPLFERALKMSKTFESFRIEHVYREQNREADTLANEAMDEAEGKTPAAAAAKKSAGASKKSEPPAAKPEPPISKPEPRKIQARFRGGVLYLLEDVELPDGVVVDVSIHLRSRPPQ